MHLKEIQCDRPVILKKETHLILFYLYKMSNLVKNTETKSRLITGYLGMRRIRYRSWIAKGQRISL